MDKINDELNKVYYNINEEIKPIVEFSDQIIKYINPFKKIHKNSYKENFNYEERCYESNRLLSKHINYVPVIIDFVDIESVINKNKFLVPIDLTVSQFIYSIRKSLSVNPSESIFIFFDNVLLPSNIIIGEFYENYLKKHNINANGDRFLYATVTKENTFGNYFSI